MAVYRLPLSDVGHCGSPQTFLSWFSLLAYKTYCLPWTSTCSELAIGRHVHTLADRL